jgi:hypothetical protein
VAALLLAGCVLVLAADPSPEPKAKAGAKAGEQWEYAELQMSTLSDRAGKGMPAPVFGKGGAAGGPGGAAGGAGPGPAGLAAALARRTVVKWTTGDDELDGTGWDDLATKLKMPAAKDGKPISKVKVLNHLGSEGWELVSSTGTVMTFKRKVKK